MKKRSFAAFFVAALILAGCNGEQAEPNGPEGTKAEHIHIYEATVVAATMDAQGYTLHVCSECGDSYTDAYTEKLPAVSSLAEENLLLPGEEFSRERQYAPEFVMIHFTSAVVLSKEDPYNMETVRSIFADYGVSVHYIVGRDGKIQCYVPETLVAYHAGKGTWGDDPQYTNLMNEYAIGIEVVGIGSQKDMAQYLTADQYNALDPALIGFTDAQYAALRQLVQDICSRHGIAMDRQYIIGHEEYSSSKTDPGELFDWNRLLS